MPVEQAVKNMTHLVGTGFGLKNGCRDSFTDQFAELAVGLVPLFDKSEKIEEDMPDIFKECFSGDITTASQQWFVFLSKLNEKREEPRSEVYLQETANILSMITVYAQKIYEIAPKATTDISIMT